MSDQKKESRINVEDLPAAETELTAEEARNVKGGAESIHLKLKVSNQEVVSPRDPANGLATGKS